MDPTWLANAHRLLRARNATVDDLLGCIEAAVLDYEKRKDDRAQLVADMIAARQKNEHMLATIGELYRRMRDIETPLLS